MSWFNRAKNLVEGIKNTAKNVSSAVSGQKQQYRKFKSSTQSYTYYESTTDSYTYTGSDNTKQQNNLYVEGYDHKQLNRIIVHGGQRNSVMVQIDIFVKQEELKPGYLREDIKEACEIVHYACSFNEPVSRDLVQKLCPQLDLNCFRNVDEAECSLIWVKFFGVGRKERVFWVGWPIFFWFCGFWHKTHIFRFQQKNWTQDFFDMNLFKLLDSKPIFSSQTIRSMSETRSKLFRYIQRAMRGQ